MKILQRAFFGLLLAACSDAMMSPAPPPPTTISVAYCSGLEPLWVAFQDGSGAWGRALPATANGKVVYSSAFAADRAAIATATQGPPGVVQVNVLYGTPAELETAGDTSPRFCGPAVVKTLLGTVAGLDSNEFALVRGGFVSQTVVHAGRDFALDVLPPGPRDILATRVTRTAGTDALTQIILRRNVDLPDGGSIPVLDFNAAEAFLPVVANVTLEGVGGDGAFLITRLRTSNFESPFSLPITTAGGAVRPYYALPETRLLPGDLQALTASTHGTAPNSARSVLLYFRAPADRALGVGAEVIPPTITTVGTTPSLRLRAQFTPQSDYDRETSVTYSEDSTRVVSVSMTATYAALIEEYEIVVPDLSGVPGFDPAWALHPAQSLRWSASRIGGTLGLGIDPQPFDGAIQRRGFGTDTFTP